MKAFTKLTHQGQVRRLRILARNALHAYNLQAADFHLLQHGENTTFRVDLPPGSMGNLAEDVPSIYYHPNRYLLRVHRSGYQNEASIASELMWLDALRATDLPVPEPIPNQVGARYTIASAPGVPEARVCSVLRWMKGRFYGGSPFPRHTAAIGRLMACLHAQSESWQSPAAFTRRTWDAEGLFGNYGGFNLPKQDLWSLIPPPYAEQFRRIADQTTAVMAELDAEPGSTGLVHADLHLGNMLFARDPDTGRLQARPIDFDDCGFAHWVYDFAAVLGDFITEDDYLVFRDALLVGYEELRPLPEKQLAYLNLFIAARLVSLMLWATDMAQVNKGFAPKLGEWYAWAAEGISTCIKA